MISLLALLAAVFALANAAWRTAAALGADGALRVVAAAPLGATAAALALLILGRFDLSGSAPLLLAIALIAAALAKTALPPVKPVNWPLRRSEKLALGAAAGLGVAWAAWVLRHPGLGIDVLTYHLTESVIWAQQGDAGSVRQLTDAFPVGNYPLLDELLVSGILALGKSFPAANLWPFAMVALTATAGMTGLRRAGVALAPAAAGVAAVLAIPIWAQLLIGTHTDLAALAWLTSTAALAAAARSNRNLLIPAILAAGLAIGTKTTTAPVLLALALFVVRPPFPPARLLIPALLAAAVTGGLWYLRNWIDHGSPLWPFVAGGDPVPPIFRVIDETFMGTLKDSLSDGRADRYWRVLGAGPALIAGVIVAAAVVRTRRVVITAAVAALAALAWTRAPFTGRSADPLVDFAFGTTRYLVPAIATAAAGLCLAWADGGPRTRRAITVFLTVCTAISLWLALDLGYPDVPGRGTVLIGALVGLAAARFAPRAAIPLAALGLAALVIANSDDYAARHARNPNLVSSPLIAFMAQQPGDDVYGTYQAFSVLAGDRLEHDLFFVPAATPCAAITAKRGWVIVGTPPPSPYLPRHPAAGCLAGEYPVYDDGIFRVYDRRQTAIRSSAASTP